MCVARGRHLPEAAMLMKQPPEQRMVKIDFNREIVTVDVFVREHEATHREPAR